MSLDARKIRSIYDDIDSGSYKAAIQTCSKLLKKQPNDLVKTLKALALVRSMKLEEGVQLADEVMAAKPTEEDVLGAMTHVLRALERPEDIITLFDNAYKKQPQNEELGAQAFMAMVRIGSWKTAQQIALKMSKSFKETRLLHWSVMCAVLQATTPDTEPTMKKVLLALALRLLHTNLLSTPQTTNPSPSAPAPTTFNNADTFHLHLQILLAHTPPQLEAACDLLSTPEGKLYVKGSLVLEEVRRDVVERLEKWEEERALSRERIENGGRNWTDILAFIDSTFSLLPPAPSTEENPDVVDMLSVLNAACTNDLASERGAHLAVLEVIKRLGERKLPPQRSILESLGEYLELFGSKACCFEDLKPYVDSLSEAETVAWLALLQKKKDATTLLSIKNVNRSINVHKFIRYSTPARTSAEEEFAEAISYVKLYAETLTHGKDLANTELQPADDFALLAANALVSAWTLSKSETHLHQIIYLLEYATQRSPQNYQFRLILIRIYRLLAAHSLSIAQYKLLRIKQIQNDTLSHLILTRGSTFSLTNNGDLGVITECTEASQIYTDNSVETTEMLAKAFQHEKYSQIPEFIEFEDRVDNSLQRDLTKIEHTRVRYVLEMPNQETIPLEVQELDYTLWKKEHHENRDYSVFPNYQPRGQSIDLQTEMGPRTNLKWLNVFSKIYLLALEKAAEPSYQSPALSTFYTEELEELTVAEKDFLEFSRSAAGWLWPSDKTRPDPSHTSESVLAKFKTGKENEQVNGAANGMNGHASLPGGTPMKSAETSPDVAAAFFQDALAKLKQFKPDTLPWEYIHAAALAQEAYFLFKIESAPYIPSQTSKPKKADPIAQNVKNVRQKALAALRDISAHLSQVSERLSSPEVRKAMADDGDALVALGVLDGFDHDFSLQLSKKVVESRKAMFSGMAKGIARVCSN